MPPRIAPTKLSNWPWVVVRVDCVLCTRKGCYRLARLAARYGPEQNLDGLLRDLAQNCPWYNERARKYEPRCGARFTDLDYALPPPDHPDEPIYRQRQPSREDVAKPKGGARPAVSVGQGPRLSEWSHAELEISCPSCGLCRVVIVAELRATLPGGDMAMSYLRNHLTGGCVVRKTQAMEQCEVVLRAPMARSRTRAGEWKD